VTKVH